MSPHAARQLPQQGEKKVGHQAEATLACPDPVRWAHLSEFGSAGAGNEGGQGSNEVAADLRFEDVSCIHAASSRCAKKLPRSLSNCLLFGPKKPSTFLSFLVGNSNVQHRMFGGPFSVFIHVLRQPTAVFRLRILAQDQSLEPVDGKHPDHWRIGEYRRIPIPGPKN